MQNKFENELDMNMKEMKILNLDGYGNVFLQMIFDK